MSNKVSNLVSQLLPLGESSTRSAKAKSSRSSNGTGKRFVLMVLADIADDDGYCWPRVDELCRRTEMGRATVFAALKSLEEDHQFLERAHRYKADGSYAANAYRLNLERLRKFQRPMEEIRKGEEQHALATLFDKDKPDT